CGASVLLLRRTIDRDAGFGDVGDHARRVRDLDLLAVELRRHDDLLRSDRAGLLGNFAGPKLDDERLLVRGERPGDAQISEERRSRNEALHDYHLVTLSQPSKMVS